jgi:CheY-like chemotaxis protein
LTAIGAQWWRGRCPSIAQPLRFLNNWPYSGRKGGPMQKMAAGFSSCGGDHLAKKSELVRARAQLGMFRDILIVEDETIDAERLSATLRVLFGYETQIRWASSLGDAVDRVIEQRPCVLFLDDILKPSATASQAIPLLRDAGYAGPIIVVSGQVTHARRSSLIGAGANDVIHKDFVDSVRVAEALAGLHTPETNLDGGA